MISNMGGIDKRSDSIHHVLVINHWVQTSSSHGSYRQMRKCVECVWWTWMKAGGSRGKGAGGPY